MTAKQIQYAVPRGALYFRPAARFDALRLALAFPSAVVLAAVVGGIYGAAEFDLQSLYFRVGAVAAAAVVLGLITGAMLRVARVHHRALAVLAGALVGAVGLWASWVTWVWRFVRVQIPDESLLPFATNPRALYGFIQLLNVVGVWSYRSTTVRGHALTVCWVLEALVLILGCTLVAASIGKPGLVCPACRKPCKGIGGLGRFNGEDTSAVSVHLESHDFDYLLTLGVPPDDDAPEILLRLECCPCGQANLLSARRVAWEFNAEGGRVLKERTLVEGLALTPEQVAEVRSLKGRLSEPPDPTGESSDDALASPGEG